MARCARLRRAAGWLLAGVVGIVTLAVVGHAAQTFTTPNAAFIPYNLGQDSGLPITLPSNQTVLVMGGDTDFAGNGDRGVGQATLVRNSVDGTLTWVSFDHEFVTALGNGGGLAAGDTHNQVVPVFYLDQQALVVVESSSTNNIQIVNTDSTTSGHKGNVTMIW